MCQTININGELMDFNIPKVMGIINVTPDSFFSGSRTFDKPAVRKRVEEMIIDGVDIFDIGGYSSRPGAVDISPEEEYSRLARGIDVIRDVNPNIPISVDTFRANVARRCVEDWNIEIINDISGGDLDPEMPNTVADLKKAYILMHMRGNPSNMQQLTQYDDVTADVIANLAFKIDALRQLGVADIIVDPGFGFAKTVEQNFKLLRDLKAFEQLGCPILAGLSRKTMIWRTLDITPEESANGTSVLNTVALLNGAHILRVHDVKIAAEAVKLISKLKDQ